MEIKTEDNILWAAEHEFLSKGYARTTTADIAKLAGVNHALLHYYYRSKENLFIKVFEKNIQTIIPLFCSLTDNSLPLKERIQNFIEVHFDYIIQNPQIPYFIINEILSNTNCVQIFQRQFQSIINEINAKLEEELRQEYEAGHINNITAGNLIYEIISLNICAFVAMPVATQLLSISQEEYLRFVKQRKAENVVTILGRLYKK